MTDVSLPWEQAGWLDTVQLWIDYTLAAHGLQRTSDVEQLHIRPWSTVLRVPTTDGCCFFKAAAPVLAHEAALTQALAALRPELLPELVAVDEAQGWLLMRDSGTPLRTFIKAERSLDRWRTILPHYVALQKDMMAYTESFLALGVPDRRLATLPQQFARLVADEPAMLVDQPDGLSTAEYQRLQASVPTFTQRCRDLDAFGIPATLHHDDFHDGNLFVQDGQVRFTDWGESAITHPFFTLVVLLRGASNSLDLADDAPPLAELRDWYLSAWTDYAPLPDLQRMVRLTQQIGLVNRALTWHRVIAHLPARLKAEYALAVPAYLQEFVATLAC